MANKIRGIEAEYVSSKPVCGYGEGGFTFGVESYRPKLVYWEDGSGERGDSEYRIFTDPNHMPGGSKVVFGNARDTDLPFGQVLVYEPLGDGERVYQAGIDDPTVPALVAFEERLGVKGPKAHRVNLLDMEMNWVRFFFESGLPYNTMRLRIVEK